jgi:hypothetical protein
MTQIRHNYDYGSTYRQALRVNWQIEQGIDDYLAIGGMFDEGGSGSHSSSVCPSICLYVA